jgi:hypothetical protein
MRFRRVIASHRDPAVAIGLHCLDAGSGRAIDGQACPVTAQPGAPVPYYGLAIAVQTRQRFPSVRRGIDVCISVHI